MSTPLPVRSGRSGWTLYFYYMTKVPYKEPALDYAGQLKRLKERGLVIENEAKALHLLENISYFRLSGYWYPILAHPKSEKTFKPGSSFNQAFSIYCFDRELRKVVSGELEKIEIAIRAKMIYILSHAFGPFWFHDRELFISPQKYEESISKLRIEKTRSDEFFIKDFDRKYSDSLPPSWMILEISSFGNLSSFYYNLKPGSVKRTIANHFGLEEKVFESWLHCLVYVRNICAHHTRLWNRVLSISPKIPISPSKPWLKEVELGTASKTGMSENINNRTFFLLCMIIYLLGTINPNHSFSEKIKGLLKKYPLIDLKAMGFTQEWESEAIWNP
jgi:abortive infection bacteriophage resistance protein